MYSISLLLLPFCVLWTGTLHVLLSPFLFYPCLLAPPAAAGFEGGHSLPVQRGPPSLVPCGADEEGTTHCCHRSCTEPVANLCKQQPRTGVSRRCNCIFGCACKPLTIVLHGYVSTL